MNCHVQDENLCVIPNKKITYNIELLLLSGDENEFDICVNYNLENYITIRDSFNINFSLNL